MGVFCGPNPVPIPGPVPVPVPDSDPESCHELAGLFVVILFGFGDFGGSCVQPVGGVHHDFSGTMDCGQSGHFHENRGSMPIYDGLCAGGTHTTPLTPHGVMLSCQPRVSSILAPFILTSTKNSFDRNRCRDSEGETLTKGP